MRQTDGDRLLDAVRGAAHPLTGAPRDYDPLLALVGDARFVLLGEATHGTHDFYHARAEITKRLIEEKGFTAVAAEADWPDAYRVNRYVRGASDDALAVEALGALAEHLERQGGGRAKIAVWAHNSHVGDARATQMGQRGELDIGQLARERYGREAVLVGFTTHEGTARRRPRGERRPSASAITSQRCCRGSSTS